MKVVTSLKDIIEMHTLEGMACGCQLPKFQPICADNVKGFAFWNPKLINKKPDGWPIKTEKTKNWTDSEKERVLEAISHIPEELWNKKLIGIYRMEQSKDFPNPASSLGDMTVLYNSALGRDRNLAQILSHEFAHQYFKNLTDSEARSYRKATDWFDISNSGKEPFYTTSRSQFVQEDGKLSVEEDFANNIEYYLFRPDELKKITPGASKWIQNRFGDKFKIGKGDIHAK